MADISLSEALNMFVSGAKDFALTNAITSAQDQVQQIKMSGISEAQQRQALGSVAQNLVLRMSSLGADANRVQQASNAILPQVPNSPEAAILQGSYTGNQGLLEAGEAALDAANSRRLATLTQEENIRARADQRRFSAQEAQQSRAFEQQEKMKQLAEQNRKPTAGEFAAAGYAQRVMQAEQVFNDLATSGYDASSVSAGVGRAIGGVSNLLASKEAQRQSQAERNFVNAVLRRESGAAIAPSEFQSAETQYFPRAGDSPEVLAQKKSNREAVIAALAAEGEKALGRMNIQTPTPSGPNANISRRASKYLRD